MPAIAEDYQPASGISVTGVRTACLAAGYKYKNRDDLFVAAFPPGTALAGVTTRSACASPEVEWCRARLAAGDAPRALVVSSGNSNAFTGVKGRDAAALIASAAAERLGVAPENILLSATGVIGEPIPADRGVAALAGVMERLSDDTDWIAAARTIGTTDTFPKVASATAIVDGRKVSVTGIAKGSGMIAPDMATMLAYVFTDADVAPPLLQQMVAAANLDSFSSITVDSDTSTSDTFLAFATGAAQNPALTDWSDSGAHALAAAIRQVAMELAELIVRDGEGATKLVRIAVSGAVSDASARTVALSIANSPLVKTAIAGEDANWGRVVMAVGKAGEPADRDRLSIRFGGIAVAANGARVEGYDEAPVARHLKGREVDVGVDLGLGEGQASVLTCDLTHGYISINADYRS